MRWFLLSQLFTKPDHFPMCDTIMLAPSLCLSQKPQTFFFFHHFLDILSSVFYFTIQFSESYLILM